MAIEMNGYNDAFKSFVDFAQAQMATGNTKAVARDATAGDGAKGIGGRAIAAATTDRAYAFRRSDADKTANDVARKLFRDAIAEMFGGEKNIPENVKRAMLLKDYGKGKPLTARRIMAVKAALDGYSAGIASAVGGQSPAAAAIRGVYARCAGGDKDGKAKLAAGSAIAAKGILNRNLCSECKKFATGKDDSTFFKKDVGRSMDATLGGGKKLSNDFATARDELAEFATGGAKTSYAQLDKREKAKVHVIMALLTQESQTAGPSGAMLALSADGRTAPIVYGGGETKQSFAVSFAIDGTLEIECRQSRNGLLFIDVTDEKGKLHSFEPGPGSKVESAVRLSISPDELERLAGLDYSKYDDAIPESHIADETAKSPHFDIAGYMGDGFAFGEGVVCDTGFKITAN